MIKTYDTTCPFCAARETLQVVSFTYLGEVIETDVPLHVDGFDISQCCTPEEMANDIHHVKVCCSACTYLFPLVRTIKLGSSLEIDTAYQGDYDFGCKAFETDYRYEQSITDAPVLSDYTEALNAGRIATFRCYEMPKKLESALWFYTGWMHRWAEVVEE